MSLSIAQRILFGFSAVIVVIVALGLYAIGQLGAVREATDMIVSRDIAMMRQLDELGNQTRNLGILRRNAVIASLMKAQNRPVRETDIFATWRRTAIETDKLFADLIREADNYRANAISSERAATWERLYTTLTQANDTYRRYRDGSEAQLTATASGDIQEVENHNEEVGRQYEATTLGVERADRALNDSVAAGQQGIGETYERSRLSIYLTLAASVLLAMLVTWLISRAVVRPLEAMMSFVDRVGDGDLSGRMEVRGSNEIARLGRTMNVMVDGLSDLARTNRAATSDLNAAAAEIRASAQQQAASVEEQFAAVQETAATVDEITHSGAQIGKRATEVIATAQATAQTSRQGLRAVSDTAKAMDAIREQAEAVAGNIVSLSEKTQTIGDIIETVNDISERTHLLALNAAIEAASAGESGRSFAVVASERKLLADQAKAATASIAALSASRCVRSEMALTVSMMSPSVWVFSDRLTMLPAKASACLRIASMALAVLETARRPWREVLAGAWAVAITSVARLQIWASE
ncbi:methyl-accepting chemotaxis protein, partial [Methylobacterium sp. J-048]|uniref:methyl-accepting chemotaxis protein n=1 Tax=Methylobacterium sp. J-048 TaxID=2836635 RepID=UPI001FBA25DE